jgi:DNA-binding transcriptional ArsR family regulator
MRQAGRSRQSMFRLDRSSLHVKIRIYENLYIESLNMQNILEFKAEFFKALAHPVRIHIIDSLREGELSVNELKDILNIEAANVSQQLSILRNKNLVIARKDGNNVYYSIKDPMVFQLLDLTKAIFNNHLINIQTLLEGMR